MKNAPGDASYFVGDVYIGSAQVYIVSDQRGAGAYRGYAGGWMNSRITKVGPARFVG